MDKELRKRLIEVLEDGASSSLTVGNDEERTVLKGQGYLVEGTPKNLAAPRGALYTSIAGRKYLERLKSPKKAWLKRNWFAASIAAVTGATGLVSVVVQIVGLFSNGASAGSTP